MLTTRPAECGRIRCHPQIEVHASDSICCPQCRIRNHDGTPWLRRAELLVKGLAHLRALVKDADPSLLPPTASWRLMLALQLLAELRDPRSPLAPYARLLPAPPGTRIAAVCCDGPADTGLLLFRYCRNQPVIRQTSSKGLRSALTTTRGAVKCELCACARKAIQSRAWAAPAPKLVQQYASMRQRHCLEGSSSQHDIRCRDTVIDSWLYARASGEKPCWRSPAELLELRNLSLAVSVAEEQQRLRRLHAALFPPAGAVTEPRNDAAQCCHQSAELGSSTVIRTCGESVRYHWLGAQLMTRAHLKPEQTRELPCTVWQAGTMKSAASRWCVYNPSSGRTAWSAAAPWTWWCTRRAPMGSMAEARYWTRRTLTPQPKKPTASGGCSACCPVRRLPLRFQQLCCATSGRRGSLSHTAGMERSAHDCRELCSRRY